MAAGGLNALAAEHERISASGTFREKVRHDLVPRVPYACGLLMAADVAKFCGVRKILALEFGVAQGDGLLNLCSLAPLVTRETGVEIEVAGFDTGSGLPPLTDYRDHPELWQEGEFRITDKDALQAKLPPHGRIIWGDVADTLPGFMQSLTPDAPIGFASMDMDIYRSTKDAMGAFLGDPQTLLPVTVTYFDDLYGNLKRIGNLFRNRFAGQALAIQEFNAENALRKLDCLEILPFRRPFSQALWLKKMYGLHVHDHPFRNRVSQVESIAQRAEMLKWPL